MFTIYDTVMRTSRTFAVSVSILLGMLLHQSAAGAAEADVSSAVGKAIMKDTLVYIGAYAPEKSKGIHLFRLQPQGTEVFQNVTLVPLGLAAETANPSFLEIDLKRRLLFAVNEVDEFESKPTGAVSAFSIDSATGKLTLLNQRSSMGKSPCHLALDHQGRNLLVTNCGSGSVAVLPLAPDGRLGEPTDFVQHTRSGIHAQGVTIDPADRFVFISDAGSDKVMAYRFGTETGKLAPSEPAFTAVAAGAGPRRLVFRPDGRFAYVLNERNSTIVAFAYDSEAGLLAELQTISTLPGYWDGVSSAADLQMHPSGKYLFASNDGHNSVVLFTIDPDEGTLSWVEEQGTGGVAPRHFGIEPAGGHLAISNQGSGTVLASRIDSGNGRLKPSGIFAEAPSPACVKFLPPVETSR